MLIATNLETRKPATLCGKSSHTRKNFLKNFCFPDKKFKLKSEKKRKLKSETRCFYEHKVLILR